MDLPLIFLVMLKKGGQMLALPWTRPHDEIPCPAPLPKRNACGSQSGGMGGKISRRRAGPPVQPTLGETAAQVFKVV
jgi:hypothetical protein